MINIIDVQYYNNFGFQEKEYEFEISDAINKYLDKHTEEIERGSCYLGFFDRCNEFKQVRIVKKRREPDCYLPRAGYIIQLIDCIITHHNSAGCITKGKIFGLQFKQEFLQSSHSNHSIFIFGNKKFKDIKLEDENNNNNNKGEKGMNLFKNLNVGKYTKSNVAYSVKGMAYKTVDGQYVAYCDGELIDVTSFLLDIGDMFFAIPVAYNSIKAGDVILHNSRPVIVAGKPSTEAPYSIPVVYPETKETRNIIPEKNIFNFNFVVKIVNPMEDMLQNTNADASNPFGNLLPFMLMSEGNTDFKDIMLMSMFNGNALDANPLVLYSLMNENGNDDFMKFMLLSQMSPSTFNFNLNGAPADNVSNS